MCAPSLTTGTITEMIATKRLAIALLAGACWLLPATARAHEFEPERQLLVQVFPDRVDLMIEYLEAPGERSQMFTAHYFFGFGGQADQVFEEVARRAILPRLLDGLRFEVAGEQPRTDEPEVKIRHIDGRLMAAAMVSYDLPTLGEEERRTFVIHTPNRSLVTTGAVIYGGDGLTRVDDDAQDLSDDTTTAPEEPFQLGRDQRWQATFGFQ